MTQNHHFHHFVTIRLVAKPPGKQRHSYQEAKDKGQTSFCNKHWIFHYTTPKPESIPLDFARETSN